MSQWFRVFGANDAQPAPVTVLQQLSALGVQARGKFHGDDLGWFEAELVLDDAVPMLLERYLTQEDDLRAELNSWAAWLETVENNPHTVWLMGRIISTQQLFTLYPSLDETELDPVVEEACVGLCHFLAGCTAGLYQVDNWGLFDADGTLLVPE